MRPLASILLLALTALSAHAAETPSAPTWPMWDGQETVEQYAKRAGLEPTKTLDLGNGIKMEMVLIPAGKFTMGTEEPVWIGVGILAVGGLVALLLIAMPVTRAIRQRRRPQFSLRWLILLVAVVGVAQYGGVRWWRASEAWRSFFGVENSRAHSDVMGVESPAHEVTICAPFHMGKFEVTQQQYQQAMGTNPSRFKGRDLPVDHVSWDDVQGFCKKASEKTNLMVRLPTEAEWEYACRAGTTTRFCSGDVDRDLESVAWFGSDIGGTTHPVGQKMPNAWGLYDMHGNVCEWCADRFEPYKAGAVADPQGPAQGEYRVLRGGSSDFPPWYCRSAYRHCSDPGSRSHDFGFRVVVSLPPTAP